MVDKFLLCAYTLGWSVENSWQYGNAAFYLPVHNSSKMKINMLTYLAVLLLLCRCNDSGSDSAAGLNGKWKLEKIIFSTDLAEWEVKLPATYVVHTTFEADGTYLYQENGTQQKFTWKLQDQTLVVTHADGSTSEFTISQKEDGTAWTYQVAEIDLTKELDPDARATVDFAELIGISGSQSVKNASKLTVFFNMTKV